jgi:hypothetical protein
VRQADRTQPTSAGASFVRELKSDIAANRCRLRRQIEAAPKMMNFARRILTGEAAKDPAGHENARWPSLASP